MTHNYNIQESKKFPIILNWLSYKRLIFLQTLNNEEQAKCKTSLQLLEVLRDQYKPLQNEMIL